MDQLRWNAYYEQRLNEREKDRCPYFQMTPDGTGIEPCSKQKEKRKGCCSDCRASYEPMAKLEKQLKKKAAADEQQMRIAGGAADGGAGPTPASE